MRLWQVIHRSSYGSRRNQPDFCTFLMPLFAGLTESDSWSRLDESFLYPIEYTKTAPATFGGEISY